MILHNTRTGDKRKRDKPRVREGRGTEAETERDTER